MKLNLTHVVTILSSLMFFTHCGGAERVAGTARMLKGATGAAREPARPHNGRPANGQWLFTPDKVKISLTQIRFKSSGDLEEQIDISGCEVEFLKATASLEKVLDCSIQIPVGTWNSISVKMNPTSQIYLSDTTNNFYTTSAGIVTTAPAGGAEYLSFTSVINGEFTAYLPTPFEVKTGDTPTVSVIGDLTHTVRGEVSNSGVSLAINWASISDPVQLLPVAGTASKIAFYSSSGTAHTFRREDKQPFPGTPGNHSGETEIRVFYSGDDPSMLFLDSGNVGGTSYCGDGQGGTRPVKNGKFVSSATAAAPTAGNSVAGGYLGRDSNGNISWARASDFSWTNYTSVFTMPEKTSLGTTGTLSCGAVTSDPKPSSGDTYASGPPTFTSQATSVLTLVAQ